MKMETLRVYVLAAKNLLREKDASRFGCYVEVEYSGEKKTTSTQSENKCLWNEILDFKLGEMYDLNSMLTFYVRQSSFIPLRNRHRIIGWGKIKLENVVLSAKSSSQLYELILVDRYNRRTHGILQLKFNIEEHITIGSDLVKAKESGYFIIDVCRAEGLPRMDLGNIFAYKPSREKLVDCYCVISFADEEVTTTVIKQNTDPVWNERLYLPFDLPLENHLLKLQLKDEDILSPDDLISTSKLAVKDITPQWQDIRQMPCFGPSFINFYGASRRFQLITTYDMQRMNTGKEEGCAFRGRVLLAINTKLGKVAEDATKEIPQTVISKSLPWNTSSFVLRVTFFDCTLLRSSEVTTLEVSLGLFGDSQIDISHYEKPSCVSSFIPATKNTNILQYYASWPIKEKPCILYHVEMQGNIHRIERSNCFHYLINILENFIAEVSRMQDDLQLPMMQRTVEFFAQFIEILNKLKTTVIDEQIDTDLDHYMHQILLRGVQLTEKHLDDLLREQQALAEKENSKIWLANLITRCKEILALLKSILPIDQPNEFPDVFVWLYSDWKKVAYCRIPVPFILYSDVAECKGKFCDLLRTWKLKFPFEVTSSPDSRLPGVFRASLWFGTQQDIDNGLQTQSYASYIYVDDNITNESKWVTRLSKWTKLRREKSSQSQYDRDFDLQERDISKSKEKPKTENSKKQVDIDVHINNETFKVDELKTRDNLNEDNIEQSQNISRSVQIAKSQHSTTSGSSTAVPSSKLHKFKTRHQVFHFPFPCLTLQFKESHLFELRCYVYQAKELLSGDKTGFSDPFFRVTFYTSTVESRRIPESLCPIWEQMIVLSNIDLPGPISFTYKNLPEIFIEIYDKDEGGHEDYLGLSEFYPEIGPIANRSSSLFKWISIKIAGEPAGELLTCAELILMEKESFKNNLTKNVNEAFLPIPTELQPELELTSIEIVCIGLRLNYRKPKSLQRPSLELYYNELKPIATTDEIEYFPEENNFKNNYFNFKLMLPKDEKFLPSLTVRLKQRGGFSKVTTEGVSVMTNLSKFFFPKKKESSDILIKDILRVTKPEDLSLHDKETPEVTLSLKTKEDLLEDLDWWSKYFASIGDLDKCGEYIRRGFKAIKILPHELEEEQLFKDSLEKIKMYPICTGRNIPGLGSTRQLVAELKLAMEIRREDGNFKTSTEEQSPLEFLGNMIATLPLQYELRLYLIRAHNLTVKDFRSSDPFVRVKIGDHEEEVANSLRHNTVNPIFGCLYETTINLAKVGELVIEVVDRDLVSGDDLIGATAINLDDRILAPCWATCGVSTQYMLDGPYTWRDYKPPSEILNVICSLHGLTKTIQPDQKKITISGIDFTLSNKDEIELSRLQPILGSTEEVLALKVVRQLNLVIKEHIETRILHHPTEPSVVQGQLEMWLDLLPVRENIPETNAVDIKPRESKSYELRCIIYNLHNVIMDDATLIGDRMSDVYVKGWLKGMESAVQKTDVHFRSLDGEAFFNWRFIFPFKFVHGENVMVHFSKQHFLDVHLTEIRTPLTLCLQICDYDTFSRDEELGTLELELMELLPPHKKRKSESAMGNRLRSYTKKLTGGLTRARYLKSRRFSGYKSKFKYYFTSVAQSPPPPEPLTINMFKQKRVRGFWSCPTTKPGSRQDETAGEIEMEIELLTAEEAKEKLAGKGREEPNTNPRLEAPIRPYSSFHWLSSPLKFLKYMCCVRLRLHLIILGIVLVSLVFLYIFFKKLLEEKVRKTFGGK